MSKGTLNKVMAGMDGPLPGENMLAERRNYPWHRPPEFTSLNEALDHMFEGLKQKRVASAVYQLLELRFPISFIAQSLLFNGVARGKWTLDMALLMAGPLAHMLVIIARELDIEFELGVNNDSDFLPTLSGRLAMLRGTKKGIDRSVFKQAEEEVMDANPELDMEGGAEVPTDMEEPPLPEEGAPPPIGFGDETPPAEEAPMGFGGV